MNYEEKRKQLEDELELLELIKELGIVEDVNFTNKESIFFNPDVDITAMRAKLNGGKDELASYFMDGEKLALFYRSEKYHMIFYVSDYHNLLEKISGGKCRVEEVEQTSKEKVVICDKG